MIRLQDVRVKNDPLAVEIYKQITATVSQELFAINCGDKTTWSVLEELAVTAMERSKGKIIVGDIVAFCDGKSKVTVSGETVFTKSGLIAGWQSWLVRDFAAWAVFDEKRRPAIVIVEEDLRFSRTTSWTSGFGDIRILSVKEGSCLCVINETKICLPLIKVLAAVAMYGLRA